MVNAQMARGFVLSIQTVAETAAITRFRRRHLPCACDRRRWLVCRSEVERKVEVMEKNKEAFSKRMALAGLQPHHRIGIGVSGGPDSMALCLLTAGWKSEGKRSACFVPGLLAIIVDHGLRPESRDEAALVSRKLSDMGIRCHIASCNWPDGKPRQGHLQEAAREMRYQLLQDICIQNQIGVLLTAHHADDQAELFILRLSRKSGVLGLAGMAFTSQIFSSTLLPSTGEPSKTEGILLVRPLLCFSKEDMYKICQGLDCDWVEDPTNRSPLYVRNRIRMSLEKFSSCSFRSELQTVISACRRTRAYVDQISHNLINQAVIVVHQGYAIIDLKALNLSELSDICLSKFVGLVLQFISQRQRPIRGGTSTLLLNYIRTYPCKTSITVAGCYVCPAPGSKGSKVLVCCSVSGPLPSNCGLVSMHCNREQNDYITTELEQIIATGRSYTSHLFLSEPDVNFLDATSDSVLTEARRLNMISESTYRNILLLREDEIKRFKAQTQIKNNCKLNNDVEFVGGSQSEPLQPGKTYYFMNRFLFTWKLNKHMKQNAVSEYWDEDVEGKKSYHNFCYCGLDHDATVEVRHMIEADWLYLASLSRSQNAENLTQQRAYGRSKSEEVVKTMSKHVDFIRLSAQESLKELKEIPGAARQSLPVLVDSQGQLLSVPSIGFKYCPCFTASCIFKPRIPLGGGHTSFL